MTLSSQRTSLFLKENLERKNLNEKLAEGKKKRQRKEEEANNLSAKLRVSSKAVLTFQDLCYDVPVPSGHLRLLHQICGYVRPGELTALMVNASSSGFSRFICADNR